LLSVDDTTEPMMLGQILKLQYTITGADAVYSWMGQMEAGDEVVLVWKLDPSANGIAGRFWQLRDPAREAAQFPVWIEDIRAVKLLLTKDKVRRGRSSTDAVNPIDVRWEISIDERERYITTLPIALLDGENEDPHARKRRPAQFAEPEQEPNKDGSNPEGGNESSE
jgi:hypothetical protein